MPASGSPSTPLLSWRSRPCRTPLSGCSSGNATLARLTSGTDVLTVHSGRLHLVSMSCGTAKGVRREGSGTGTGTRVSPRLSSLLFLLGEELYRQPRAVYKYWAGGLRSCDHAATSSSSSSISICFRSSTTVGHSCYASETGIRSATVQVLVVHRAPVMDVPVIIQFQFLHSYENVVVPQIPFLNSVLQLQLCFRGVYAQCKLCSSGRFHSAVLRRCLRAHCCVLTGAGDGPDSAEHREVSARVLGLARCCKTGGCSDSAENREVSARVLGLVHCPSLCNDRCRMVETVQKTVEFPQLVLSWTRLLTCPCLPRHGLVEVPAVAVHRLVCLLIMAMMSL